MTHILDRIAKMYKGEFHPSSPDEYFALRLAQRLGEPGAAGHYAILVSQYSQQQLLCAFQKTMGLREEGRLQEPLGRVFQRNLETVRTNGNGSEPRHRLLAARIERRIIAIAVFDGTHLEGRRVLQLSSNPSRAESSTRAFIRSLLAETECTSAAIEPAPGQDAKLRNILHQTVTTEIQLHAISLWEISIKPLLNSFAYPPLKNRPALRQAVVSIWPMPGLKAAHMCALDAFAIGLFVQTERLFNNF